MLSDRSLGSAQILQSITQGRSQGFKIKKRGGKIPRHVEDKKHVRLYVRTHIRIVSSQ